MSVQDGSTQKLFSVTLYYCGGIVHITVQEFCPQVNPHMCALLVGILN